RHIVIATGGRPMLPPGSGAELGLTSDGFFEVGKMPPRVGVVGSGDISVGPGRIFAALGAKGTMGIAGGSGRCAFDGRRGARVMKAMRDEGVEFVTNGFPQSLSRGADGELELVLTNGRRLPPADAVVWAIGRAPLVEGLGLEAAGVKLDAMGFIDTDKYQA